MLKHIEWDTDSTERDIHDWIAAMDEQLDAAALAVRVPQEIGEAEALRLAACDVAALSNTRESYAKAEIGGDNPAWSVAYVSVRNAVLREIEHREALAARAQELVVAEGAASSARCEAMEWQTRAEQAGSQLAANAQTIERLTAERDAAIKLRESLHVDVVHVADWAEEQYRAEKAEAERDRYCSQWIDVLNIADWALDKQAVLHQQLAQAQQEKDTMRCNICDQPVLHEIVCEDCLSERGYVHREAQTLREAVEAKLVQFRGYRDAQVVPGSSGNHERGSKIERLTIYNTLNVVIAELEAALVSTGSADPQG